jgi:hypothetical protein
MSFLQVDLTLTNYGQRTARDVATSFEWTVEQIAIPGSWPTYEQPQHPDVAPKNAQTVRLQANRGFYGGRGRTGSGDGIRDLRNKLLVYGVTRYKDGLRGTEHRDVWCFQYDPSDSSQVATLQMRICTYQPTPPQPRP